MEIVFKFRGFGVFKIVTRMQKVGRNPKDPKKDIVIPTRRAVKFMAGKRLLDQVKKKQISPF